MLISYRCPSKHLSEILLIVFLYISFRLFFVNFIYIIYVTQTVLFSR